MTVRPKVPAPFRYRRLGYLELQVTDAARTAAFLTGIIGLDEAAGKDPARRYFRSGPHHHDVVVRQGAQAGFVRSSWELETDADLDAAFAHFAAQGLAPAWIGQAECDALSLERAFRIVDPVAGASWEYYNRMTWISSPLTAGLTRFQGGKHFAFTLPDPKAMNDFLVEQAGFLVSDYVEGWLGSLVRAFPHPDHHTFGALPAMGAGKTQFHHFAFRVEGIDDIGQLVNRARRHGVVPQFGIGRHPTSGSIHFYVYDPDWFIWEYTMGMEQFPETGAREARRMSAAPEDYDLWQAVPDSEHAHKRPIVIPAG